MVNNKERISSIIAAILLIIGVVISVAQILRSLGGILGDVIAICNLFWFLFTYIIEIVLAVALIKGKKDKICIVALAFDCISSLMPFPGVSISYVIRIIGVMLMVYIAVIHSVPWYEAKQAKTKKLFWLPAVLLLVCNIMQAFTYKPISIYSYISIFISACVGPIIYLCIGLWLVNAPICFATEDNSKIPPQKAFVSLIASIIVFAVVLVIVTGMQNKVTAPYGGSNWDKLSDEEKEWYHNNYGDGKMENINNAIDGYKNR
ncbi:MAG: hypothetical protein ACI4KA_00775 [Oscillospiraceae bacterium]